MLAKLTTWIKQGDQVAHNKNAEGKMPSAFWSTTI
jgi:hypothetical protein